MEKFSTTLRSARTIINKKSMFKKITLPNGLRLVTAAMPGSQSTTVLVLFGAGSKYETKTNNGISHFLEHMFFKGTKKRPTTLALSEFLDRVGGEYNAFTAQEMTGYYAKVAPEYVDMALDWVSDILLNSKFDAKEIAKERGVITEEYNMYLDNPARYVGDLWEQLLYGDQPAGWQIIGTKDNIAKMARQNFLDYFSAHYQTKNAVICLAGKVDKDIEKKVVKYFSGLKRGEGRPKLAVRETQKNPAAFAHYKTTDQTHLRLGVRAYDMFHKDRYALMVLSAILGGMMSSRLWISVREKKGLAYYVRCAAENYTDSGFLVTQAGVANNKVAEAIAAILVEYRKICEQKINAAEINKAKEWLQGSLRLGLETSDEMASWIGVQELLRKEILTPEQIFSKIKAVSAQDLQRVARDIFQPAKLNLALIGPFKEKERFEKLLCI
ncbi:MAG: Peptidase M16 domain protein [Parcubacteria group bacterium GW2011_GWA2_43_9b]|nr:MAG: Peptidase M16 domain protein [Parcubacteria group bacterium GW2011_GWA2_43_9b]